MIAGTPVAKQKTGVVFDEDDGHDLLNDLGFNESSIKPKSNIKHSSKYILDDLLGRNEALPSPVDKPKPGFNLFYPYLTCTYVMVNHMY